MPGAVLCACGLSGTCSETKDRARILVQITHPRVRALRRCSGIVRLLLRRTIAFARPHSEGLEWNGLVRFTVATLKMGESHGGIGTETKSCSQAASVGAVRVRSYRWLRTCVVVCDGDPIRSQLTLCYDGCRWGTDQLQIYTAFEGFTLVVPSSQTHFTTS